MPGARAGDPVGARAEARGARVAAEATVSAPAPRYFVHAAGDDVGEVLDWIEERHGAAVRAAFNPASSTRLYGMVEIAPPTAPAPVDDAGSTGAR